MGLDRSVHSDETADGVTLPVAPGAVVRGDLAQTFTPPPPPDFCFVGPDAGHARYPHVVTTAYPLIPTGRPPGRPVPV